MTDAGNTWSLCNPGPEMLRVWLEPWCDEFALPGRSVITLIPSGTAEDGIGEVEYGTENVVVWASAPNVEVFIDEDRQPSGSALIAAPAGLTKAVLGLAFAGQPAARLGGAVCEPIERLSLWRRIGRLLRW